MKNNLLAVLLAGIWVAISEYIRNEFLLKVYWINHFMSLGLAFVTTPFNGILWLFWSFILVFLMFVLLKKFSLFETIAISWLFSFVLMWIVVYNLQVFPLRILIFSVPLSLLEVFVAGVIIKNLMKN
jgi:hypothetical protein